MPEIIFHDIILVDELSTNTDVLIVEDHEYNGLNLRDITNTALNNKDAGFIQTV